MENRLQKDEEAIADSVKTLMDMFIQEGGYVEIPRKQLEESIISYIFKLTDSYTKAALKQIRYITGVNYQENDIIPFEHKNIYEEYIAQSREKVTHKVRKLFLTKKP